MKHTREQRWSPRKRLDTEVVLHFPTLDAVRAKTRDISYGGMRLDVKPLVLSPNTTVRVTLIVRHAAEVVHRTIEAVVIYMNRHGCGLKFDGIDRSTFRFLQTFMHVGAPAAAG